MSRYGAETGDDRYDESAFADHPSEGTITDDRLLDLLRPCSAEILEQTTERLGSKSK
jgi:hypothetical protein